MDGPFDRGPSQFYVVLPSIGFHDGMVARDAARGILTSITRPFLSRTILMVTNLPGLTETHPVLPAVACSRSKVAELLEVLVDAREPHVGDLVELR